MMNEENKPNLRDESVVIEGPMIEIDLGKSFLEMEFNDLTKLPLYASRRMLVNEINDLKELSQEERTGKLDRLFKKILGFQQMKFKFSNRSFSTSEQRFFVDMISIPGFLDNPAVEEFLDNDSVIEGFRNDIRYYSRIDLLLKFREFYKTHDKDIVDKLNYIFKSTDNVTEFLFENPELNFEEVFDERFLSLFDNDELSFLYRFNYDKTRLFNKPENKTAVFVLAELYKKLRELTGPNYEYLESMIFILDKPDAVTLLESYFDWVRVNASGKSFSDTISIKDNLGTSELITFLIYYGVEINSHSTDIVEFLNTLDEERKKSHEVVLGRGGVEKVFYGVYDEVDLPNVSNWNSVRLEDFKNSFLENVYGINLNKAKYIAEFYGKHLDEFFKGLPPKPEGMSAEEFLSTLDERDLVFKKEDYTTLQILSAICKVCSLTVDDENLEDKLRVLQTAYLKNIREKGVLGKSKYICFPVLENALNKLYLNSFEKRLMHADDSKKLIGMHEDVMLLDAGVEFDMIITSIGAVKNIFDDDVNMALKWNTASGSLCQGLCTSHISSQNMGVFTIEAPILGFADLDGTALNMMGTSDIWTYAYSPFLKKFNEALEYKNRTFVPGTIMADETRYGYNELLLDRFVNNDEEMAKLQPSYVVYFKFNDDYKEDSRFHESLKVASDFKIPIMVVDVYKIKEYEQQEINKMKEELFSKDTVDKELVHKIITRYMNNYTGAENFVGYFKKRDSSYPKDFSCDDIDIFIDEYLEKAKSTSSKDDFLEWTDAFGEVYANEKRKYLESRRVSPESYSVRSFLLDDILFEQRVSNAKKWYSEKERLEDNTQTNAENVFKPKVFSLSIDEMSPSNFAVLKAFEMINTGSGFNVLEEDSNYLVSYLSEEAYEDKLYGNLVLSYLFENTSPLINEVVDNYGKKEIDIKGTGSYNFIKEVMNSPYKEQLLKNGFNEEKIDKLIARTEMMIYPVCQTLFPYFKYKYGNSAYNAMKVINNVIDKGLEIRSDFNDLKKEINAIKNNEDNIGETGKKL